MVKNTIKAVLRWVISKSPGTAKMVAGIRRHLSVAAEIRRHADSSEPVFRKFRARYPELRVLNGPFRGMLYPSREAAGSEIHPKILGSYEKELHDTITYIAGQNYTTVVDVGCAEGYYAVGFAMILKGARVYAFDTNPKAVSLCARMAEINGVEVVTGGFCNKDTLLNLNLGEKTLVFSDCEGYENLLFDRDLARKLSLCDFLIETHDFIDIETTRRIHSVFAETHDCLIIESIDDIIKAYTYDFVELHEFSLSERRHILEERRPTIMRWVFAKSTAVSRDRIGKN